MLVTPTLTQKVAIGGCLVHLEEDLKSSALFPNGENVLICQKTSDVILRIRNLPNFRQSYYN